mgnify:CR=1 FL=1
MCTVQCVHVGQMREGIMKTEDLCAELVQADLVNAHGEQAADMHAE